MSALEFTTSVFKRSARTKRLRSVETGGKIKEIKVKGGWIYRIRYVDPDGQPRTQERSGWRTKNDAKDALNEALRNLERSHGNIRVGERMTFEQLVESCKKEFYKPAVLRDGKKIAGIRSSRQTHAQIENLKRFFGKRLINSISLDGLIKYKEHRTSQSLRTAKTEEAKKKRVSIATVNRELSAMRKMMRFAYREGWLLKDIFYNAKVIEAASENARNVTLSLDDESKLLAWCEGEHEIEYSRKRNGKEEQVKATINMDNPGLLAMIILALDSGMRKGEILKLRWHDIDFDAGYIRVVGTHTKTERERLAPLSDRARAALEKIRLLSCGEKLFLVNDIKTAFNTATHRAGLSGIRFHDLRRSFVTRQLAAGTSPMFVAKVAGHAQIQTTMKHYTAIGVSEIHQMNESINAINNRPYLMRTDEMDLVN